MTIRYCGCLFFSFLNAYIRVFFFFFVLCCVLCCVLCAGLQLLNQIAIFIPKQKVPTSRVVVFVVLFFS
jgi:hypothetical protein